MKRFYFFITVLLVVFAFLGGGCRSTKFADEQTQILADGLEVNAKDDIFKIYDTDFASELGDDEKFIFLRLYFPNYENKLSGVSILKGLIASVDPNPDEASHSAIGFDLHDERFYGLTSYKPQCLKIESCIDVKTNKYMKKCDEYTSFQTTLAIKVSEEEYQTAKAILERDYAAGEVRYFIPKNLPVGLFSMKRKHKKTKEERSLGGIPMKKGYVDPKIPETNFVCSSYIAYVLANSVQGIRDFFMEKEIDYAYVIPTDLIYMPGATKLFASTWIDYNIAAEEFVRSAPIFADYLY